MAMNRIEVREHAILMEALGLRTRVLEAGAGAPVVLLHGNPDNADEWRPLMGYLAKHHRCIAPDFPGYGKSPMPPARFTYSLDDQMRFLEGVLQALQVAEPFVLVVHDTGGMVGTAWAAANRQRLRGMMYTNCVAFEGFAWFAIAKLWGAEARLGRLRAQLGMLALGLSQGALFRKIFAHQSPQLSVAQLDRFASSFATNGVAKATALRQFREFMRPGFFAGFDVMRARLLERVPCRVLWGDQDPYIPVHYARCFGGAHVTILPEAGHWVPLIAPQQLAEEISQFH
jgi:pimeloyl-ACP methyl ester carboxylesterase